jgi:hypothetical protein
VHPDIVTYNKGRDAGERALCELLASTIEGGLLGAESKIWHAHPVWFLDGNPIVGYSKQKPGIRLMFWSGADFDEPALSVVGKKFRDASLFYNDVADVDAAALRRWLRKGKVIQWDYRNIVRNKGKLIRLT